MLAIIGLIFPFFALIGLGFGTGRIVKRPLEGLAWLNVFIVYLALPALFFQLLSKTPVEQLANPGFVGATTLATFVTFLAVFTAGYVKTRGDIPASTIQGLAGAYGNIGYMGPGLAILVLGDAAAVPVALIVCFENAAHFVVAPAMMALAGGDRRPAGDVAIEVLRRVALHPFILSTAAGFAVAASGWQPPVAAMRLVDYLAQAAAPCALFAMGVTLALRPLKRVPVETGAIAAVKLLVLPAVVYVALRLVGGRDQTWVHAAVLLAALPTATNVFVISQHYGAWQERASATVLITTVLSIATLPLVLYLISAGFLPVEGMP